MSDCSKYFNYDPSSQPSSRLFYDHNCSGDASTFSSPGVFNLYNYPGGRPGDEISYFCAPNHICVISDQGSSGGTMPLSQMGTPPKFSRRIEKGPIAVNDGALRSKELGCCHYGPNYDYGWHSASTVEIQETKKWDQFQRDCCTGKEDPKKCSSMIPKSATCDNIIGTYCQNHLSDPICACYDPNAIAPASCFYAPCTTSGYVNSTMFAAAQRCPSYINCSQYINLSKTSPGSMNAAFQNVALSQNCTINQEGGSQSVVHNTSPGDTTVNTPGYVPLYPQGQTQPQYTGVSTSKKSTSMLWIWIILIIFVFFIFIITIYAFSGDDEVGY